MKIFVSNESTPLESRVALTPEAIAKLRKSFPDVEIAVETAAGKAAGFPDEAYTAVGAEVLTEAETMKMQAPDIFVRVSPPAPGCIIPDQTLLISLNPPVGAYALNLARLPRTSRAQALDVLSSQANLAGYAAVLLATRHFPRLMPMLMTAAGAARPAAVLILGVGVAGLQAIATARRLGAQVTAFDLRPEVAEQIRSLGAKPLTIETPQTEGEGAKGEGGYAGKLDDAAQKAQQQALAAAIAGADVVITTAQVPGAPAPILASAEAVNAMKPGSVLLDMAAGGYNAANGIKGGNCPLSKADEVVTTNNGATILAPTNLASLVAGDASRFFATNLVNLFTLLFKQTEGKTTLDFTDELIAAMRQQPEPTKAGK